MAQRGPSRPLAGTKATNCCSIHFHVVAIRGRLLLCLGLGNSFLLFGGLCFLLIAALLFRLLLRRLFLRCLLLLLGRRGLRLFQDLVRHLGELLALLLHVGTQEHRLIILRQGVLFVLHLAKPLFELSACRRNRGKLLRRNVPKLVSRSLDGIPVVRDRARDGLDPLLPHAGLLEAPCDGVADPLQLVDLVDEHGLGSIERVIQPVLGLSQVAGESLPLGCRDEVFVDARLRALVAHVEDVSFQVVFLLVRLDDVAHLRLHRALGIHELLQHLGAQAGATRGGDLEVSLLGALFRFLDLHPLVLLLGLCLLFLLLRGLLFVGGALFVFFLRCRWSPEGCRRCHSRRASPARRRSPRRRPSSRHRSRPPRPGAPRWPRPESRAFPSQPPRTPPLQPSEHPRWRKCHEARDEPGP
mmetsp:Transcript_73753/g.240199  ORF Transcript_73753/g.240199 Transcript_73753/m.240199 type:complete len:413 (+) Transcript_73753:280-1518(+)